MSMPLSKQQPPAMQQPISIPTSTLLVENLSNLVNILDTYGVAVIPLKNISTGHRNRLLMQNPFLLVNLVEEDNFFNIDGDSYTNCLFIHLASLSSNFFLYNNIMAYVSANNAYFSACSPTGAADTKCTYNSSTKTWTLLQDISLNDLTTDISCIQLGAGEIFDGARYTISVGSNCPSSSPGVFKIDASSNPVGQILAAYDGGNTDKCTIQNLTVDSVDAVLLANLHGGFVQHAILSTERLGVYFKNCITKRVRTEGSGENGGFTGWMGSTWANITYENCVVVWEKDFPVTSYVSGGLGGVWTGRVWTNGSGGVQRVDVSGCIAYIEMSTSGTDPGNPVAGYSIDRSGAFFGKGLGAYLNTLVSVENCYVLIKVGETLTAHGLANDGFITDITTVVHPHFLNWGWRGTGNSTQAPVNNDVVLNTAFQSTPWDSSEYTATATLPVFLTAGSSGSSGGDPYIFPLKSNIPVKLPNTKAVYRMFEQGNTFINAQVDRAAPEHMIRMIKYAEKLTPVTHNITTDGFFYSKFFIHAEGREMIIDLVSKKVHTTEEGKKFFTMKQLKTRFDDGEFDEDAFTYRIKWNVKNYGRVALDVLFFPNPHMENGIKIRVGDLKNATGMLIDNYKPKLMKLPSISTLKYDKLHRRLNNTENVFQKKAIKGKNEKWHLKK